MIDCLNNVPGTRITETSVHHHDKTTMRNKSNKLKVWYAPDKIIPMIRCVTNNLYEREILLLLFEKYIPAYRKDNSIPDRQIIISYKELSSLMADKTYYTALHALKHRGVIKTNGIRGRKGGHQVSIITQPIVSRIVSREFSTEHITGTDSIAWI